MSWHQMPPCKTDSQTQVMSAETCSLVWQCISTLFDDFVTFIMQHKNITTYLIVCFLWTVKGTNYSRTAMCHIYVNTQYISPKFGIHVRYVNSTYCVKFELICMCYHSNRHFKITQRGELKKIILSQWFHVDSWNCSNSLARMSLHTIRWFELERSNVFYACKMIFQKKRFLDVGQL